MGLVTADDMIGKVEELLGSGFYDASDRDEALRMLRVAELLTTDATACAKIGSLRKDIRTRYGGRPCSAGAAKHQPQYGQCCHVGWLAAWPSVTWRMVAGQTC